MGWKMSHASVVPMTVNGRKTYVYCASGGVAGVDAASGALLWTTDKWKISIATVPTPIILPGNRIFLTGGYNSGSMLLHLAEQNGRIVPEVLFRLSPAIFGSDQMTPIYYNRYIYGVIPSGELVCLDLTGRQVWHRRQHQSLRYRTVYDCAGDALP